MRRGPIPSPALIPPLYYVYVYILIYRERGESGGEGSKAACIELIQKLRASLEEKKKKESIELGEGDVSVRT